MTWLPIWTIPSKVLIAPLVASSLSYGLFAFIAYGDVRKEHTDKLNDDKEQTEMKCWSQSLSDPTSPNYQTFTFINK